MTTEQHTSQLLTVPEVAERLRLSKGTVYRLVRTGVVPASRMGGEHTSIRVRADKLERWLDDEENR
ncbi:MAG: helix-turn-helix domain-containing protein [Gaiellaceae bacterium]